MPDATVPQPTAEQRRVAGELRIPLVWVKAYQAAGRYAGYWGWTVCTDPEDWTGSSILASGGNPALEQRSREKALRLARSWADTKGVCVGELP